jgi:nucleoside-diphosphate-sugar epimerase
LNTVFSSSRLESTGFKPPVPHSEGLRRTVRYEFLEQHDDGLFYTEYEFLFVEDLADAALFLMERYSHRDIGEIINIGTGVDCTIRELAHTVARVVGFSG